jgi:protocatechuate 3,4-dioxygenase beta subunit
MRPLFTCLLIPLLSAGVLAQAPVPSTAKRATVQGIVTKDPDGQPVKKALIELIAENQSEDGNYTAETGPDGTFRIENVMPGRYRLFAERTGFLDIGKQMRSDGQVLSLREGQEVTGVHIRLQAAAVIRGRVTDEDGDPMQGAEVAVMRQTFASGHRHWEQVGAERTNDLGEYRVAGLAPGNVYVSVNPPPDFRTLIENGGTRPETRNAGLPEKPAPPTYQTTYYPGTSDRSQASPIQIHAGDDFPVNFSLVPGPSLSIRGSVVNLPPRSSATVMLQSHDFNLVMNGTEIQKDGSFVIRDVSPGTYTIQATVEGTPVPMTARQTLQVGSANVEGLRLAPQPGATIRGRLRLENGNASRRLDPERIFLDLRAAEEDEGTLAGGEKFSNVSHVAADGSFEWNDVPSGRYYVQLIGNTGSNEDWFLKSVLAGGRDVNDSGISVNGGLVVMDLVASANGGMVEGAVTNEKGEPVSNAVVVAVPEARWRGREDRYRQTVSDQSGRFSLHGIRPGDYTLFAWESVEEEAYYNPDFVKSYEGQGTTLRLNEGEQKVLQLGAIPQSAEQQ